MNDVYTPEKSAAASNQPTFIRRVIEKLSERVAASITEQAAPVTWTASEAARQQEMRDWLRSHRVGRPAANDAGPLETHKKVWLELVT